MRPRCMQLVQVQYYDQHEACVAWHLDERCAAQRPGALLVWHSAVRDVGLRALKVAGWAGVERRWWSICALWLRWYVTKVELIMKLSLDDALEVRFSDVRCLAPPCSSTDVQVLSTSTHIKLM